MPDHIIKQDVLDGYIKEMARYAISDNRRRMVPEVKDGLKPVQRRVLYSMAELGAYTEATKKKSARIVGDCMGKYHPHGDCLGPYTQVYLLDGTCVPLVQLYNEVVPRRILAVDRRTGSVVPAVAHDFRIGQYTNEIYHIVLSNGNEITCTSNHPFMLPNGDWIKAENIKPYTRLYTQTMLCNGRPRINGMLLQDIVYEYYNGKIPIGYDKHHADENIYNNTPENLIMVSSAEHAKHHKSYYKGYEVGRSVLFGENSPTREATRQKNSILMSQFNAEQGIRRFQYVISKMKDNGMEITEENYESMRGKVYNLPIVSRLISRHPEYGCETFDDLVNLVLPTVGELYHEVKSATPEVDKQEETVKAQRAVKFMNEYLSLRFTNIYSVIDRMIDAGLPYCIESYYEVAQKHSNDIHIGLCLRTYQYEKPYVVNVWVEKVNNMPMYDFTVDDYENMLIPICSTVGTEAELLIGNSMPMICAHNSSLYGAIKPIANWWECKIPLAVGFGNWGTFQGDGAASMRYTEAYLSEFTTEFMRLLNKYNGIVDWSDNFDNTTREPDYLPFMLPVLLINGASGIGVGMRMDLPPHNPHEVLQITRKLLRDPNTEVVLVPDFCMPCEIIDANWKQISNTGSGKFKARGIAGIGEYKGYPAVFVRSLPQGVNSNAIEEKLETMTQKGIINQIRKIYWEGNKNEVCLVIQLKKGASPEYMLDVLYKYTPLESSYSINFEAIYGIDHLRFSYKSYLELFIETAKNTLFRMYCEMYQTEMTKWHELDAYIKVIQSGEVDNIYKAIRKSTSADLDELVQWLCNKIDITDLQAGYIIKSDLGKFSKGFLKKYMEESKGCFERANQYRDILLNDARITDELDKILDYYDKKYCKPRICRVVKETDSSSIPKGTFKIVVTENNYVRKLLENDAVNTVRGDRANYILTADNNENILLFANTGKVFKLPVYKIGLCDKNNNGVDIRTLVKGLTSDICNVMYEPDVQKAAKIKRKHYMVVTTAGNTIKKLDIEDFVTVPPSGIIYTKLNPGDVVTDVSIVPDGMDIVVFSGHKALRMNLAEVNNYKRNSVGVAAMKSNDPIEGMNIIYDDITHIVVVTRLGKVNRFIVQGLERGKRAQAGSQVIKLSSKDAIAGVYGVNDSTVMRIITTSGYYDINAKDIPLGSSVSAGTKIKESDTGRTLSSGEVIVKVKLFKQ